MKQTHISGIIYYSIVGSCCIALLVLGAKAAAPQIASAILHNEAVAALHTAAMLGE
jgi:hypothetical protein